MGEKWGFWRRFKTEKEAKEYAKERNDSDEYHEYKAVGKEVHIRERT